MGARENGENLEQHKRGAAERDDDERVVVTQRHDTVDEDADKKRQRQAEELDEQRDGRDLGKLAPVRGGTPEVVAPNVILAPPPRTEVLAGLEDQCDARELPAKRLVADHTVPRRRIDDLDALA